MNESFNSKFLDDPQFQSLLVACLESLQRGEVIDHDSLSRDYPQYAAEVNQFLEDRQLLEQVAAELQDVDSSNVAITAYEKTLGAQDPGEFELNERIRYIGEYEILDEVARGGMGIVFKAKQQSLGRIVALKMILSGRLADEGDVERFQREAKAAGRLKHSHIVPVHEIGEFEGRQYFTMDFVDGQSLAEIIRDETIAPKRAASLIQMVAEAVDYAHQRDIVHRDLKPANILIDAHEEPQITDFGLAKILESVDDESKAELTASGQILGTPSYMSPEQASGKQDLVGQSSDIYSLGAILYACLTGRAPFVADSPVDTLLQVIHKDPVSPRDLNPAVPKDLETICLKCLSKEPKSRYNTAQELADDLACFVEGKPISARPVTRLERAWRWAVRNPVVATLMTLFILSLIAGTGISSYFAIKASDRAHREKLAKERQEQLREESEKLAEDLQRSLNLESELRNNAQQSERLAKLAQRQEAEQRRLAEQQEELAVQRETEARWHLYVSQLYPLMDVWKQDDLGQLDRLLDESIPAEGEPDFRHWEWYYLRDQTRQTIEPLPIQNQQNIVAYHHDTQRLAVLFADRVEIWDPWSKKLLKSIPVKAAIYSRHCVDWAPDGRQLVFFGANNINILNVETGELIHEIDPQIRNTHLRAFDWSPDGKWIATGTWFGDVKIWNAETGDLETTLVEQDGKSNLDAVCWHHDSKRLALALRYGWTHLYDTETKQRLWARKAPNNTGGISLGWSPQGDMLAVGNGGVALYTEDGKPVRYFDCHRGSSRDITWTDDVHFVSGGSDQDVVLINTEDMEEKRRLVHHSSSLNAVIWDDAKQKLITASNEGDVKIVHLESEHEQFTVLEHERKNLLHCVSFSPDGQLVIGVVDHEAAVWDLQSKELVGKFVGDKPVWYANWIQQLRWSPDSQVVVGTCKAAQPVIWKRATQETMYPRDNSDFQPWAADWSPDGNYLALSGGNRSQLWDGETFELVKEFEQTGRVQWTPDGKAVRIGSVLIDPKSLEVISSGKPEFGFLSPDQKFSATIADGHAGGESIEITSMFDGKSVVTLRGHNARIKDIAWTPDGKRLGSASLDGTIKIWDTATGDLLITLAHPEGEEYHSICWSPDGRILAAGTTKGALHLYGRSSMEVNPDNDVLETGVLATVESPDKRLSELKKRLERDVQDHDTWLESIDLLLKTQKWQEALNLITSYLEDVSPGDSWRPSVGLMVASALGDELAIQKFTSMCLKTLRNDSLADHVRAHAAQALCVSGIQVDELEMGVEVTRRNASQKPGWYFQAPLAITLLRAHRFDELRKLLDQFADNKAPQFRANILLMETLIEAEQGEIEEARKKFEQAGLIIQSLRTEYIDFVTEKLTVMTLNREANRQLTDGNRTQSSHNQRDINQKNARASGTIREDDSSLSDSNSKEPESGDSQAAEHAQEAVPADTSVATENDNADRSGLRSVYLYAEHNEEAEAFRELVKSFRISAEIVAVQDLSSQLLSEADLVVVGSDTAAAWENSSASQMIRNAQVPVLAMGQGGYRFFGGLELEIGSPHGNHGTTTSLRPDEEAIFWDAFQPVPVDGVHNCYTEAQCISIKLKESRDDVFPIAAEPDREKLYPLIAQKPYYFFWGFDGQLDQLTRTGRHLLPWACHYTVAMKRNPEQAFQSVSEVKRIREQEKSASDTR